MASNKRNPKDEVMEDHDDEEEDSNEAKDVDDAEVLNYYKLAATAVNGNIILFKLMNCCD